MILCYVLGGALIVILLLYGCFELHYFLRTGFSVFLARFVKKKVHILEETTVSGLCITTDIDTFLYHMNNSRFLRELDFAKADFYERTNLYRTIRSLNGSLAMGATTIRYRRFIRLYSRYLVTSKIIYWDDQGIYMEHRFITPKDSFINAIAFTKTRLLNCSVDEVMGKLLKNSKDDIEFDYTEKPNMPLELAKWIESNEISHASLRGDAISHI